jgi:hypothetical protein
VRVRAHITASIFGLTIQLNNEYYAIIHSVFQNETAALMAMLLPHACSSTEVTLFGKSTAHATALYKISAGCRMITKTVNGDRQEPSVFTYLTQDGGSCF